MNLSEQTQHELLLVITSLLFILFSTGKALPPEISSDTTIITSA